MICRYLWIYEVLFLSRCNHSFIYKELSNKFNWDSSIILHRVCNLFQLKYIAIEVKTDYSRYFWNPWFIPIGREFETQPPDAFQIFPFWRNALLIFRSLVPVLQMQPKGFRTHLLLLLLYLLFWKKSKSMLGLALFVITWSQPFYTSNN